MSEKFEKFVEEEINSLKVRMDSLENRMDSLENRMDSLENRMDSLEKRIDSIEKMLDSINRAVILIEDQVMNKIPALFDGYVMHQEKQEQQEESIESLNGKVENHDIRISYLEEKTV